jgi:hypothetical protein
MSRLEQRFAELKTEGRSALVTFVTAGDPGYDASLKIRSNWRPCVPWMPARPCRKPCRWFVSSASTTRPRLSC